MAAVPDLISYLHDEFVKAREKDPEATNLGGDPVEAFVEWCRDFLSQCPPSNVVYLQLGLGLRLLNGATVAFTPQNDEAPVMRDEGVHITKPQMLPGMGIRDSGGIGIFGR